MTSRSRGSTSMMMTVGWYTGTAWSPRRDINVSVWVSYEISKSNLRQNTRTALCMRKANSRGIATASVFRANSPDSHIAATTMLRASNINIRLQTTIHGKVRTVLRATTVPTMLNILRVSKRTSTKWSPICSKQEKHIEKQKPASERGRFLLRLARSKVQYEVLHF